MLKDFCNWTRQNPSQKELCFNQLGNIRSSCPCHPTQLGSNAYYKNFGYGSYHGMTSYRQIFMQYGAMVIGTDGRSACCTLEGSQENLDQKCSTRAFFLDGLSGHLTLDQGQAIDETLCCEQDSRTIPHRS
ncbi:hypothetical protein TNCV_2976291 [Trichonephila clavipes]|nr:hypothetical protein TNCV_2976291 [Trichonephila clavipes]